MGESILFLNSQFLKPQKKAQEKNRFYGHIVSVS